MNRATDLLLEDHLGAVRLIVAQLSKRHTAQDQSWRRHERQLAGHLHRKPRRGRRDPPWSPSERAYRTAKDGDEGEEAGAAGEQDEEAHDGEHRGDDTGLRRAASGGHR